MDDVGTIDVAGNAHQVQSLVGHINSDFTMSGEILWLGPSPPALPYELVRYSPLEMLIDFDAAGATILRESREGGVHGPRCPDPQSYCPPPLVLERAD
ncbi:MAG TPA: hypothetical protein VFP83_05525 [Candidatus Limnocylindria bacterium]|nr:hypothetical protein [Candidatus Limnocylindria bacterium]